MDNFSLHHLEFADNPFTDLTKARTYLREISAACLEGATSPDPQVVALALALLQNRGGVRGRRSREIFVLECHGCRREIEITVGERGCPHCHVPLEIQWSAR